jgi:hypothetical protein
MATKLVLYNRTRVGRILRICDRTQISHLLGALIPSELLHARLHTITPELKQMGIGLGNYNGGNT